jgi:hypothetical protein
MQQFPLHYFFKSKNTKAQKIGHLELLDFLDFQYYEILHLDIKPPSLTIVKDLSLKNDKAAR